MKLYIAEISGRGNKIAIVAGSSILRRFKKLEDAKAELDKNRKLYEYWAESVSVAVDNSEKITIIL